MPRDCMALLLALLGVGCSRMLVQAAATVTSVQDVATLRHMYHSAARVFAMQRRLRRAVATTVALRVPMAFLRLSWVLVRIVRLCFRPVSNPTYRLAYPGFAELGVACLRLASWSRRQSPLQDMCAWLQRPLHTDFALPHADLLHELAMNGLPGDVFRAWIVLNAGASQQHLRRIRSLLRLGCYTLQFFPGNGVVDDSAAFAVQFQVLGVCGTLVALEPDVDMAGFLLP